MTPLEKVALINKIVVLMDEASLTTEPAEKLNVLIAVGATMFQNGDKWALSLILSPSALQEEL